MHSTPKHSVPDYFQDDSEEALRSQVEWAEKHLGLGDSFFARLLREEQGVFSAWRAGSAALAGHKEAVLRDWWHTVLHLLSFQSFDAERVRALLERTSPPRPQGMPSMFAPPWSASSLKEYLESYGPEALGEVDRWVESFRFGDPYTPARKEGACLSTRP
jgi:hypothetical protein